MQDGKGMMNMIIKGNWSASNNPEFYADRNSLKSFVGKWNSGVDVRIIKSHACIQEKITPKSVSI